MFRLISVVVLFTLSLMVNAQHERREISATRINCKPQIDANLDEMIWAECKPATNFTQFEPYNGGKPLNNTEVKFAYDDEALYIAAKMYDKNPENILTELSTRDNFDVNSDLIILTLLPYDDGLNAYKFMVSASGIQADMRISSNGGDTNWDAVWVSEAKITDYGWVVEAKIPYSAIRFPIKDIQKWGLNISRSVRKEREWSTWSFIDKTVNGDLSQSGLLTGIFDIKPPVRLSLTPYVSGYVEKYQDNENVSYSVNGGLDLKYGINESFTVDMTLIPDFGQVQSDDQVLNLSPYETYYSEKRPFFTEGTELFNKGGIFYSRRVGSKPRNYNSVNQGIEDSIYTEVLENPMETKMINATKISGRTENGLGIGIFNAMTSETLARVIDATGKEQEVVTQPFTNYNLIVLDQSLKNNSYVSMYTTNMNVFKDDYFSNVAGGELNLKNKSNAYSVEGKGVVSQQYGEETNIGHHYYLNGGKYSGNFRFDATHQVVSDTYNPNDMGFLNRNNYTSNNLNLRYNVYKPFWKFLEIQNTVYANNSNLYSDGKFASFHFGYNFFAKTKRNFAFGGSADFEPLGFHDYYEARSSGRVFKYEDVMMYSSWISSDYSKRFALDVNVGRWQAGLYNLSSYWYRVGPRFRVNDKIMLVYNFNSSINAKDIGYVDTENADIYFGDRRIETYTNTLSGGYIFNKSSSISLRFRHYWSKAKYENFYLLEEDGYLTDSDYVGDANTNFNAFNIDMTYTWIFAPGSEMTVMWKNSISTSNKDVDYNYSTNFNDVINSPQTNGLSLKLLYYIDYQYLKKSLSRS